MKKTRQSKAELFAALAKAESEIAALRAHDKPALKNPDSAEKMLRDLYGIEKLEQEWFFTVLLDARQRVLKILESSKGTLNEVSVHPRDIFRDAIRMNAHAILMAHNHPSGDSQPSDADLELTRRMVDAGRIVGIPVIDHLILTRRDSVSLASRGLI